MLVDSKEDEGQELSEFFFEGADLTEFLNIKKYEAPVPGSLAGQVRGNFPGFIPKTDQERCQNLGRDIFETNKDSRYEVSMKMDGTSFTAYLRDDEDGVCGRNWNLTVDETNATNSLVRMYVDSGLQAALRDFSHNYAIQGELMGPAIQKNREDLKSHQLVVFDIYAIDSGRYLTPNERHQIMVELWNRGLNRDMVQHVPVLTMDVSMDELGITDVKGLLAFAEGPSLSHAVREGLVFKRVDGGFSFKAISNAFLLKEKD
jgi:RNA ligase (TIGR02306 family)